VPELPEVEVLVRHLQPLLQGQLIHRIRVRRARVLRPTSTPQLVKALRGARFIQLSRRGKYLLFTLRKKDSAERVVLVGHLGMSGRMYLLAAGAALPRHASVVLDLDRGQFVFEDTRYFGRFTLDTSAIGELGPEPLSEEFTAASFHLDLKRSNQPIKVKLLDQSLVAGVGNIYASEALFRAGVSPRMRAGKLTTKQVFLLWQAIREVLADSIQRGSTVPLNFNSATEGDGFFYYGRAADAANSNEERFAVYDRAGKRCRVCGAAIRRCVQATRSTFYCPRCQRARVAPPTL
jgi:formamidopyrimidine-DNA glycosylase